MKSLKKSKSSMKNEPTFEHPYPYQNPDKTAKSSRTPDWFYCCYTDGLVDLNHPSTYKYKEWYIEIPKLDCYDLCKKIWDRLGWSLVYLKYVHKPLDSNNEQLKRIENEYGFVFSIITREMQFSESPEVKMFLIKFLYKLEYETNNLC